MKPKSKANVKETANRRCLQRVVRPRHKPTLKDLVEAAHAAGVIVSVELVPNEKRQARWSVKRLIKDWQAIANKKEAFGRQAHKVGREMAGFRALGIASAFRYCAGRLEYELECEAKRPNEKS
jgi:hypothetical protein